MGQPSETLDLYRISDGVYRPPAPIEHRHDEYATWGLEHLARMQARHFWYRGRHRFVLYAVKRHLRALDRSRTLRVLDLGCGCGGWMRDLVERLDLPSAELAVGDSSLEAIRYAAEVLPQRVRCYQTDIMDLTWENRWDIVFLLDVIEHLPDDRGAMRQVWRALASGGLAFVTTPALQRFWTWNDEVACHQRRYSRADFHRLAADCGFELLDARYFMFFLSPLLLASRLLTAVQTRRANPEERRGLSAAMHRIPPWPLNRALEAVFAAETPLGHHVRFPWGTSILGIFRKAP